MKRAIIVGATSGIGREVAHLYLERGWKVGVAGRRMVELETFRSLAPERVEIQVLDVTRAEASDDLRALIARMGGMDLFLLSSGIGSQNIDLNPEIEIRTVETNSVGFVRMVTTAYRYFCEQGYGHLAVISSIAGTKGLGVAPAYSATKRFQNTYVDALAQLSRMENRKVRFTDIRPGFVATALLKNEKYPMLMTTDRVARHIVRALDRSKRVATIDFRYAMLVFFWRMVPRWLWERIPVRNR